MTKKIIASCFQVSSVKASTTEHQAQPLNYLKAVGLLIGLLINFGKTKLEYRRFDNRISSKIE
ncbi:GxxExxY protein [bacterium]|nr:GxxExxY protein [bacterium]